MEMNPGWSIDLFSVVIFHFEEESSSLWFSKWKTTNEK